MLFNSVKQKLGLQFNGYFVIKGFITNEVQKEILTYYHKLNLTADSRVSSYGVYTNKPKEISADKNQEIDAYLTQACNLSLNKHFKDFKIGGGIFLLKGIGENSVSMHQDWNIVDETKHISFSIWSPLIDVDESNGCLHVIPGSHKWFKNIRSSNIDSVFLPLNKVKDSLISIPLKKGDAIVFSHNLFHGSFPNKSNETRPAFCISLYPSNADYVHFLKEDNSVKILNSASNYFLKPLSENQSNKEDILKTIPYKDEYTLTEGRFWDKYKQMAGTRMLRKILHFVLK
ncbi:MAG: phytanoyl-CoA dioxygenase family protein [bacterium]|nr:phytanoyl-CoA dioxygenase family protein [bacterium]